MRELVVGLRSGNGDLRGGEDQVDLVVEVDDGRGGRERTVIGGVERGRWWLDHSEQSVRVVLPRPVVASDLLAVEVVARLKGGPPGRSWDLASLSVAEAGGQFRVRSNGGPLHRFGTSQDGAADGRGRPDGYRLDLDVLGA